MKNLHHVRRIVFALVAALGLTSVISAPTQAVTTGDWYLGYSSGGVAAPGDVIRTGSPTTFSIDITYNGAPLAVICTLDAGDLEYDVPNPVPETAPGGTIVLPLTVTVGTVGGPSNTNGTCIESVTGNPITITIPIGTVWTLTIDAPVGTSPSPWTSLLSGSLNIPQNSVTGESDLVSNVAGVPPCVAQGPTNTGGIDIPGTYDPTTGVARPSAATSFGINNTVGSNPQCLIGSTGHLDTSSEITLGGPGGSIPTLVYQ